MIAQQTESSEAVQRGADFWQKITSYEVPTQADYVGSLGAMNLAVAIILFACGLVYLLHGWKIFKMLVLANAAILGAFFGSQIGESLNGQNMPLFCGVAGALLLAVLSWPLMKIAVSLMGGLFGGFLGYGMWNYVADAAGRADLSQYAWAGALIGLVGLGCLAFVVFRLVIMIFTSVQGGLMTVSGVLGVLMKMDSLRGELHLALVSNTHLLVLIIGVPAVIGLGFQYAAMAKKAGKKKKSEGGD